MKDRLGRRPRDRRSPAGMTISVTDRDLTWFEKLHRHGPLASTYLLEYSKHTHRSEGRAKDRLTQLFHEKGRRGAPFLDRPWQQFATYDSRYNDLVYDNAEGALRALGDAGLLRTNTPVVGGHWVHRYMTAAITSSIELSALCTDNVRYIFQDEILNRAGTSLRFPVTADGATCDLIPDALFGLEYTSEGRKLYRFFLVEADRCTEPVRVSHRRRKSYERTVRQYAEFVGKGMYKGVLKLSAGIVVLNVTTSDSRKDVLISLTRELSVSRQNGYMLFATVPTFGRAFKPAQVLHQLFSTPWQRAESGSFFISRA